MTFDSISYVYDFPKTLFIAEGQQVGEEIIGLLNFAIEGDLLITSVRGNKDLLQVSRLPDMQPYGNFLSIGQGPKEVSSTLSANDLRFEFTEMDTSALIYDFQRGRLLRLDMDESVRLRRDSVRAVDENVSPFLFDFLVLDSAFYFVRKPENRDQALNRSLDSAGVSTTRDVLEQLNQSQISNSLNIAVIASMTQVQPGKETIVEMYFQLNYFNLYALDGSLKKTICLESQPDNLRAVEALEPMDRKYRFSDLRVFEDYFALLHLNEVESDFATERKSKPEILFFDWEGKPLAKIVSEDFFTSFDIDETHQVLYTFDLETDVFLKYPLPKF